MTRTSSSVSFKLEDPIADAAVPGGFTFIDLFAGIGGTRLGFEAAGGRCVWTSEWDPYAQMTYRVNFPNSEHVIAGDITTVEPADVPQHDVLLAGFPCQPFSLAGVSKKNALGRPHGFDCETQGTLFFNIERILNEKRPRAFLLENVKNLTSHDGGKTYEVIERALRNAKYRIFPKVVDARCVVPQHRERIFIVGFADDSIQFDWSTVLGTLPRPEDGPRLRSVLHTQDGSEPVIDSDGDRFIDARGRVQPRYTLTDALWAYLQGYAEKHRRKGNGFGYGLVGPNDVARTLSARYHKDGSEILVKRGRGTPRRLTPRECARLMGFPDTFAIPVSDTRAYRQFGNSIVVPVVAAIARAMAACLAGNVPAQDQFALKLQASA